MSVDIDGTTYAGEALELQEAAAAGQPASLQSLQPQPVLPVARLPGEGFLLGRLKLPQVQWFFWGIANRMTHHPPPPSTER